MAKEGRPWLHNANVAKKKAEKVKDEDLLTRGSSDGSVWRSCSIIL